MLCYLGAAASDPAAAAPRGGPSGGLSDFKAGTFVDKVFPVDRLADAHFLVGCRSADPDVSSERPSGEASLTSQCSTPRPWLGSRVDADDVRHDPV